MKITMLSTSKRQAAVRRGSEKLSDRRYFKRIPTPEPVTANCRRSVTPDVWPSARLHSMLHRSSLSTIIVLIILSITKSYSALPTDVSTVASVLKHTTINSSTAVNLVYQTSQHSGGGNDNNNSNSSSASELWAKSANVTSGSTVDGQHVDNSSVFNEPPQSASSPATATVIDNPLQINESSWSINNSAQSTGGDHWHRQHSDLISHLHCEYGTIRKYSFSSVVQSRLTPNGSTRATVLVRCLDQVTWGVGDQQDRLNGQKYIVYISDFYSDPSGDNKQRTKRASLKERSKRSIYQTFEHLWSDIRSILPNYEEDSSSSHHDDFEQDLLRSMESELRSKCHSLLFWEKIQRPDKCLHCHANPSSKFSLPFWFIQLEDGTIPQIRFTKQEVNLDVKNFKKLITSLLATQLNSSNYDSVEKSVLGQHRSHYCPLNSTNYSDEQLETNISNAHIEPLIIERHIETTDFLFEQNKELPLSSDSFLNITATFTQHIDNDLKQIINSYGQVTTTFGPSDLSLYCTTIHEHQLEKEKVFNHKMGDVLNELQERYTESQKESLIGEAYKEDTLLQEKYSDLLYRLRARLGRNEYHYYTKLFDAATKKGEEAEYDSLLRLVSLEQQLNHSMHQHNSLIGDLRRIGTIHNIQLVCSPTLLRLTDSDMCAAFLYLLLQSSSKTAQHVLLYSLQNQSGGEPSAKATMAARLLAQTYRPSRWLIENLAHEAHHQVNNRPMETALLQALTQIAQREQLVKLKELLSSHLLKRIKETLADVEPSPSGSLSSTTSELYTIDLLEMLGNLGNYTALQLVQEGLNLKWHSSDLVTIATIHAYRRSINRSQVQNQLSGLFLSANSCQIKQHIVQLLIDDVDLMFWSQTKDKRWPKYGFEPLDQILADELINSSTNCVHHLILEYFKRKVNSKASKLVGEFKASHNVTASSFDFCITEASNYKCDYVQVLGNELASVEMRKSISISKPSTSLRLNGSSSARPQSTYIYAEHSLSTVISKYKLTVAHLSLIQIKSSEGKSRLRVQLQTSTGDTIPLANVPLDGSDLHHQQQQQQPTNASAVKIAQMKLTVPVKVAASEHSPQANNALLVSMEAYFAVYLQSHWQQADSELSEGTLRIQISLKSTGEFAYSGLALQRSIDLQCKFEYESKQPVEIWQTTRQSVIVENVSTKEQQARRRMTTTPTATNENEAIRLGSEAFAGQVQLWQHSNKQYDPQCNIWMERSERQQLSHWNSTVKQSNLFALPLQPLPLLTAELPAAVATNQPANASSIVVDEGASTAEKTT